LLMYITHCHQNINNININCFLKPYWVNKKNEKSSYSKQSRDILTVLSHSPCTKKVKKNSTYSHLESLNQFLLPNCYQLSSGLSSKPASQQVVEDGYEFFAKRQLVTLFSAPNYCGEFDNAGGMMSVDESLMCSFQVENSVRLMLAHKFHLCISICQYKNIFF